MKNFSATIFFLFILSAPGAWASGFDRDRPFGENSSQRSTLISYAFSAGISQMHEIRVERFLNARWSLMYSAGYATSAQQGPISFSEGYYGEFRAPFGLSFGVGALSVSACSASCGYWNLDGAMSFFVLSCMIPDGVAYHIPVGEKFDLSPFVNISGLSFQWQGTDTAQFVYSPMGGIRIMYPLGSHFMISAEQNFRRMYGGVITSSLGGSMSVSF